MADTKQNTFKIGVIALGEPRPEMIARQPFLKSMSEDGHKGLLDMLKKAGYGVVDGGVVYSKQAAQEAARKCTADGAETGIIEVYAWTFPVFASEIGEIFANGGIKPILLYGVGGLSGFLACRGALDEIGVETISLWDESPKTIASILRSASCVARLRGTTIGVIGGRSMGILSGSCDPAQVKAVFGADVDHVDQDEIRQRALKMDANRVTGLDAWLKSSLGKIEDDAVYSNPEMRERQERSYLALNDIVGEKRFDAIALKCIPELSDGYANQCLSAMLSNDPYDQGGTKAPVPCSCESDINAALTMLILKLLNQGEPVFFGDVLVAHKKLNVIGVGNCGGAASWFSAHADTPKGNLEKVTWGPHVQGKAGGGALGYLAAPVIDVTWARLSRVDQEYVMFIIPCEIPALEEKDAKKLTNQLGQMNTWPRLFLKPKVPLQEIFSVYNSQHVQVTLGNFVKELQQACDLWGINTIVLDSPSPE